MSRILLADSSVHAQRMGSQILNSEGFTVATVADGEAALAKTREFDPIVILADVLLPGKSGYELCALTKANATEPTAVILTGGAQAAIDPDRAHSVGADGTLSKPFEATPLIEAVRRLTGQITEERKRRSSGPASVDAIDRERVEAAVTLALEAALPALVREVTERVLVALKK
jgi:DNA-binding response OmpR family regulator